MVNAAQVQGNVNELDKVVKAQAQTIAKLTTDLAKLQNGNLSEPNLEELVNTVRSKIIGELDTKLEAVKQDCYDKLERLESDIGIKIESDANATLRVVNSFFKLLDDKVVAHAVNIDVLDDAKSKQKRDIEELQAKIRNWAKPQITPQTESVQNQKVTAPSSDSKNISLDSLEARLDRLEDHSRRDNLLFTGFEEEDRENCETKYRTY